jgi:hypothetical protein
LPDVSRTPLEDADAPDFERIAAVAFERVDIPFGIFGFNSENPHFQAAFRAAQQRFDRRGFFGHSPCCAFGATKASREYLSGSRSGLLPLDRGRPVGTYFGAFLAAAGAAAERLQIVKQQIVGKIRDRPFRIVMAEGRKVRAIDQDVRERLRAAIGDARVARLMLHKRMPLVP